MDILTCNCGSATGGAFDGIVNTYADLPVDATAAIGDVYLVRQSTGVWLINRKQAGLYQRLDTTGMRDSDWHYLGDWVEEFSDANFSVYNATDNSKTLGFDLSTLTAGARRTLTVPDADGTIALVPGSKAANLFYAGPVTGSSAIPDWRNIDVADLPDEAIVSTGSYADPSWLSSLAWSKIISTPNSLSGYGIIDAQPLDSNLTALTLVTLAAFGLSLLTETSAATLKATLSLDNVENTALSTWAGSTNITTVGTISTGTWSASTIASTKGGTGLTTYTTGDTLYASASNTLAKLAGNTSATKKFLSQTGTGSASAAPSWAALVSADIPDISGTYAKAGASTSSGLTINTARILGRTTASAGALEEISVGTSLTLSAGTLNAIQDLRTSASPTFAGLTATSDVAVAFGNTGIGVLEIDGGTGTGNGAYLAFDRGGLPKNYIGASSALHSNNTDDMDLVSTGDINFYPTGTQVAAFTSTGLNSCPIGASSASTAAFTTVLISGAITAQNGSAGFTNRTTDWSTGIAGSQLVLGLGASTGNSAGSSLTSYGTGGTVFDVLTLDGSAVNLQSSGSTVGSFTSTGLNSCAIGATTPSTAVFTTLLTSGAITAQNGSAGFTNRTTDWSTGTTGSQLVLGLGASTGNSAGASLTSYGTGGTVFGVLSLDGSAVNLQAGGSTVGSFTSTGLNSCAVGTTTASTGAFTTLAISPTTTTSAPSAGGAGALPATPKGYATIKVSGTDRQFAYY